ncbi:MAG: L,D-transpeptidase family protein [Clostridiales bacterium]|nr:L,D-transpeptidase family protein [Clostridiales bacterium]
MGNVSLGTRRSKQKTSRHTPVFIVLGLIFILALIYILVSFYYNTRFYINTVINGVDTSNMTLQEAGEAIQREFKTYYLTLEGRNGVKGIIPGEYFDIHAIFDGSLEDLLLMQNNFKWPLELFKDHRMSIETMPKYDEDLLKQLVADLPFFQDENIIEPVDACISDYVKDSGYEIIPEVYGAKVNYEILFKAVKNAVENLEPALDLEEVDCYIKPDLTTQSPVLVKAVDELNKISGAEIIYEFGKDIEILDGNQISQWLSLTDDYEVVFDKSGVKDFVDYIGKTYNTFGKTRTFKTSYGTTITVKGGDYGWWLNRPLEVEELTELILAGEKLKREPAYFQTAQQYGDDDIGNTYVEVNLSAQRLFFYKNGKLIVESPFVSGNVSRGYATPTGTYPIQYKERDAILTGEDYASPVDYWMPFNRGIGFHDASWRSAFGKDIYKTNGSHGCINMPYNAAKTMFENIQRGVAVIVY